MSENFTRSNKSLEARIAQINDPLDLVNMLKETPAADVISLRPVASASSQPVGTRLRKIVRTDDGREVLIQADSYYGLDILADGVRKGQIR